MDSRIGKLYPTTKFMIMVLVVMISIFTPGYTLQYLFLPVFLIISFAAGTGKQFLNTFFKSVFIIVLFVFAIQVFIITNDDQVPIWAFLISSTIQLIPQMTSLQKTITDAQKSRGIETEGSLWIRMKAFVPMMGPLVLSSIQQTEERVLALESRAFSAKGKKTSIYVLDKSIFDKVLEVVSAAALVAYIVWRVM